MSPYSVFKLLVGGMMSSTAEEGGDSDAGNRCEIAADTVVAMITSRPRVPIMDMTISNVISAYTSVFQAVTECQSPESADRSLAGGEK